MGLVATPASAQSILRPPSDHPLRPPPSDHLSAHPSAHPSAQKPTCGVSDTTISPGDQVTVSGKRWQPGSTVTFTLQPEDINLGSTTVGQNGKFSAVVTIPTTSSRAPIVCSGIDRRGDPVVLAIAVTDPRRRGWRRAAFTGTILNVPLWMVLIAALLAAGVVAVAVGRRRRRSVGTGS